MARKFRLQFDPQKEDPTKDIKTNNPKEILGELALIPDEQETCLAIRNWSIEDGELSETAFEGMPENLWMNFRAAIRAEWEDDNDIAKRMSTLIYSPMTDPKSE